MNIILFGSPGSGKGTQADNIIKTFNLFKLSAGDLLRKETKKNTDLGKEIKSTIDKGSMVSDSIMNNLISAILIEKSFFNRILFDGYPRNLNQAKNLDLMLKKNKQYISCVFYLNVPQDVILKRILGRETCSKCGNIFNKFFKPSTKENHSCGNSFLVKRSDDNEETLTNRFKNYSEITFPVMDFYKKQNLVHDINGNAEIHEIFKEISSIIASLEA